MDEESMFQLALMILHDQCPPRQQDVPLQKGRGIGMRLHRVLAKISFLGGQRISGRSVLLGQT